MKLGLFSVSYAGLWGQHRLGVTDFIAKAGELGYSSVMLMGKRPHLSLDTTSSTLEAIRESLKSNRIECGAVAGYTDFSPPRAAEVPLAEMQFAYVASLCRIAQVLGAPVVRIFTAYEHPETAPATAWSYVVDALRTCAEIAAEHRVTLAVQNHHDVAVHSDALLELLSEVDRPALKLGFDAWSPALRGEDLFVTANRMAPYTAITTNADYVRLPRFRYRAELVNYERLEPDMVRAVPFGQGFIDYRAFFAGLAEGGFNGLANYEMCSPIRGGGSVENLDRCARTYVQWMHEHVAL